MRYHPPDCQNRSDDAGREHSLNFEVPAEITRILEQARAGKAGAAALLFPLIYPELHAAAVRQMRRQAQGHTLQPTALVNEAFLRLAGSDAAFEDRAHFMAAAALAMRQIIVDYARRGRAAKRRDDGERVSISQIAEETGSDLDVLDLEVALAELCEAHPRPAQVAELRFYGGLSVDEVAVALGVSARTVDYDWRFARAWLQRALKRNGA